MELFYHESCMKIIKSRIARYGFVLPNPSSFENLKIIAEIAKFPNDYRIVDRSSMGNSSFTLYTDNDEIGKSLTDLYNGINK